MSDALLEVHQLSRRFGPVQAVDDVSFQIQAGELVGFMGPNGAGKSTTMRLIAGYLKPQAGEVFVNGYSMRQNPLQAKAGLGYLPEQEGVYAELTVREYLTFLARSYGIPKVKQAIEVASELTRCHHFLDRELAGLSKGMRQRSFFAGALLHDPPVLVLDEPTDGLDPNQKHEMRLVLKELAKTKAVVVSTHILEEAEAICNRVMILSHGRLVIDTTPKELARQGKGDIQVAFRVLTTNRGHAGEAA